MCTMTIIARAEDDELLVLPLVQKRLQIYEFMQISEFHVSCSFVYRSPYRMAP